MPMCFMIVKRKPKPIPVMVKPAKQERERGEERKEEESVLPSLGDVSFHDGVKERVFQKGKEMLEFLEMIEDHYIEYFQSPKFLFSAFRRFECWIDLLNSHQD
eukprot:CAMPEP_0201491304 /NCGR_PEP_ID=MMETSP0151_2-20130828/29317_1 /ASSEMBLY_ACC=CAM_ASM_000257 /TAXON_ID=200890 /ORGANISM="Paramoeba atlantica, Strain 621/1 / CCAP 1560/9" /LENGTH=102 /DNA_ID=CAMNT_0047877597 /DNA_START=72 /DNA_END=377 /DNA_ORIENTATION=-